jgi:hypothetical protein
MAGSPKKRARREAKREAAAKAVEKESAAALVLSDRSIHPAVAPAGHVDGSAGTLPPLAHIIQGEILPPVRDEDVTRTAMKRAMRRKAAEHAERALEVLANNLESADPEIAAKAANDILKHAGLTEPEKGDPGGLIVQILKMAQDTP